MILVGDRRTEKGHDSVAHNPVNGTLVAVDRLDHAFEHGVEELLGGLGVAAGKQLHRTLDIGKQHGDLLALTFKDSPGGEDLIGKALRGVTLGRAKAEIVRNRFQGLAAFGAELGRGRYLASAVATGSPKRSCALLAELRLISVLNLAVWAFHRRPWSKIEQHTLQA
jgi:hypothetical protein